MRLLLIGNETMFFHISNHVLFEQTNILVSYAHGTCELLETWFVGKTQMYAILNPERNIFIIMLSFICYSWVQKYLVQATYWHDPLDEALYKNNSIFLSDINNEKKVRKDYIKNLQKLEHFVMVKFDNDTMVQPRESSWFGFYKPGQSKKLQTLQESDIYQKVCICLQVFVSLTLHYTMKQIYL